MYILRHFEVPRSDQTSIENASAISRNLAHNLRNFIIALIQLMATIRAFGYINFVLRWFRTVRYEKFEKYTYYLALNIVFCQLFFFLVKLAIIQLIIEASWSFCKKFFMSSLLYNIALIHN